MKFFISQRFFVFIASLGVFFSPLAAVADGKGAGDDGRQRVERSLAPQVVPSYAEIPAWTIEERLARHNVPGVSIAVFKDGEVLWAKGYGVADKADNRAVTTETLFQAASISKAITAFAAMKLVEDGVLDLDAPVNSILTSWRLPENEHTEENPVTMRHLLSHMGGLNVSGFAGYKQGEALPDLIDILNGVPPASNDRLEVIETPGQRLRYSGGGTELAGAAMVDVAGEPYAEIVQRTVFDPLNMNRSRILQPLPEEQRALAARGHAGPGSQPIQGFSRIYRVAAAGGTWSTPEDLAKLGVSFGKALNGDENQFLSPATAREMIRKQFPNGGSLGPFVWEMPDGRMFGHTGGNAGYRSNFYGFVDGRGGAVIMTNADNGFSLIWEIMAALAKTYDWAYGATQIREAVRIAPETAAAIAGRYKTELSWVGDMFITIEADGDGLWLSAPPVQPRAPLYQENETTFFLDTGRGLKAVYNESGVVERIDVELETGLEAVRVE